MPEVQSGKHDTDVECLCALPVAVTVWLPVSFLLSTTVVTLLLSHIVTAALSHGAYLLKFTGTGLDTL